MSNLLNNTTSLQEILETISNLPDASNGVELPELSNEGSASDLLSGKELINSDGEVVTGTIPTKTSSNLTVSGATVTVPSGYYASQATKSVATATQATPSITINSSGLITATATQTAGYVAAGSKSATKQLAFQSAKTITPTTTSQIAVSSGYYTGGNVMVAGDSNLVPSNIVSGKSIFGVTGTYAGSGGGDTSVEDELVTRTLTSYTNDRVNSIGSSAFYHYDSLSTANFPAVTNIGNNAFRYCSSLSTVSFPVATNIGSLAFAQCDSLSTANFPAVTNIGNNAFFWCNKLTTVSFPAATKIGSGAFQSCMFSTVSFPAATEIRYNAFYSCGNLSTANFPVAIKIGSGAFHLCRNLTTVSFPAATEISDWAFCSCDRLSRLYLGGSSVCRLLNSNAFNYTAYWAYDTISLTAYIYVPSSLLTSYKTATNWAFFSKYFSAIEDSPSSDDSNSNTITFLINEIYYEAENDMTWYEWCNSEYNRLGLAADEYSVFMGEEPEVVYIYDQDWNEITGNDVIVSGHSYILSP